MGEKLKAMLKKSGVATLALLIASSSLVALLSVTLAPQNALAADLSPEQAKHCMDTFNGKEVSTGIVFDDIKRTGCISMCNPAHLGSTPVCTPPAGMTLPGGTATPPADAAAGNASEGEDAAGTTSCIVPGIGWVVCPVAKFMAVVVDSVFQLLNLMLQVPPISTDTDSPIYTSWATMRNIANVAFVIAFLVIVYSQITSVGIGNYGLKRLLPRLITAAILVNLSYWVCALAVDVSNLAGVGIYDLLKSMAKTNEVLPNWGEVIALLLTGAAGITIAGTGAIVAIGVAGAASGSALLWLALPMVLMAIIAIIVAVAILAFRQALIVILIVISPLAFVAYLLPNTDQYFDKWRKALIAMLVFYPIFGFVFGGSTLAATILVGASKTAGAGTGGVLLLTAMLVQLAPLFMAPYLMRQSGGMLGKIGAKIQGSTSGIMSATRATAKDRFELGKSRVVGTMPKKGVRGFMARRAISADFRNRRRGAQKSNYEAYGEANWQERIATDDDMNGIYLQTRAQKDRATSAQRVQGKEYTDQLAEKGQLLYTAAGVDPRGEGIMLAGAQAALAKELVDAVRNIEITTDIKPGDIGALQGAYKQAVISGDDAGARAYQNMLFKSGSPGNKAWQDSTIELENSGAFSGIDGGQKRLNLQNNIDSDHGDMKAVNNAAMAWALDSQQSSTLNQIVDNPDTYSKLSDNEVISSKTHVQNKMLDLGVVDQKQAQSIMNNQNYGKMGGDVKTRIEQIASAQPQNGTTPTPTNPASSPAPAPAAPAAPTPQPAASTPNPAGGTVTLSSMNPSAPVAIPRVNQFTTSKPINSTTNIRTGGFTPGAPQPSPGVNAPPTSFGSGPRQDPGA